ncbi:MAG: ATP-binding protein [Bacteroidota bacterium]
MAYYEIAYSLQCHLDWLKAVLDLRIAQYFENKRPFVAPRPPVLAPITPLDQLMDRCRMNWHEKAILLLALVPHIKPQLLDIFFTDNPNINRGFTEFGGIKGKRHNGFLPTGETAVFILAGQELEERLEVMHIFRSEHFLFKQQILEMPSEEPHEPVLSIPLVIATPYLHSILWGTEYRPNFGPGFPAKLVETTLSWSDLILPNYVMAQIEEIKHWVAHEVLIQEEWQLRKWIKPGYRCLFFGPPGTGKTLTASLIGKELDRPVYRIDLSMVVSKYIGETEKNLARVFDQAEQHHWILFFDEADALFGKRTQTKSSHDRYANQEVSYLLQRIEDYPGLVILASNFKGNLDEAFIRRFQSMIHFPVPSAMQRYKLWEQALGQSLELSSEIDLERLAEEYEVTGGEIINILRTAAIHAASRNTRRIELDILVEAIKKEFSKSGKVMQVI